MKVRANNGRFFGKVWAQPAKANDNAPRGKDVAHGVSGVVLQALCKAYGWASPLSAHDIGKMTGFLPDQVAVALGQLEGAGHIRHLWGWWYPRRDIRGRPPVRGRIKWVDGHKVRVCPRPEGWMSWTGDLYDLSDAGDGHDV